MKQEAQVSIQKAKESKLSQQEIDVLTVTPSLII